MLEKLKTITDTGALIEALRAEALASPGVREETADAFALGYLAAYVCAGNKAAQDAGEDDVRPLTDSEVDELLVNVSISKLEALLRERRAELADTPDELRETLDDIARTPAMFGDPGFPTVRSPWCAFPGCPNERDGDNLFCDAHTDNEVTVCARCGDDHLPDSTFCTTCDGHTPVRVDVDNASPRP